MWEVITVYIFIIIYCLSIYLITYVFSYLFIHLLIHLEIYLFVTVWPVNKCVAPVSRTKSFHHKGGGKGQQ
jgi:hypothetical protein